MIFARVRKDFTVALNGVVHLPGTLLALAEDLFDLHAHNLEDVTDESDKAKLTEAVDANPTASVVAVGASIGMPSTAVQPAVVLDPSASATEAEAVPVEPPAPTETDPAPVAE